MDNGTDATNVVKMLNVLYKLSVLDTRIWDAAWFSIVLSVNSVEALKSFVRRSYRA